VLPRDSPISGPTHVLQGLIDQHETWCGEFAGLTQDRRPGAPWERLHVENLLHHSLEAHESGDVTRARVEDLHPSVVRIRRPRPSAGATRAHGRRATAPPPRRSDARSRTTPESVTVPRTPLRRASSRARRGRPSGLPCRSRPPPAPEARATSRSCLGRHSPRGTTVCRRCR